MPRMHVAPPAAIDGMTIESPPKTQTNQLLARVLCALSFLVGLFCISGCRNPYAPVGQSWQMNGQAPPGYPAQMPGTGAALAPQATAQVMEQSRRVQQLDDNNRQLTTQLAQAQQQFQAERERADLLAKQLVDMSNQNRQLMAMNQQYANQTQGMQASMNSRGGAKLTANNSITNSAAGLQIAGARVIPDGDLIRIRVPADQLFAPGTAQFNPAALAIIDQVAGAILRQFSRQRISIEGHTDTSQPFSGAQATASQLAAAQAQAVSDQLVRRGGVPSQQLFLVVHGPNHPIADNQTPAGRAENRRIEIVVYPDTY